MTTKTPSFSLKDHLFNPQKVDKISKELKQSWKKFDENGFYTDVLSRFPELELKERITWITVCLKTYLPQDYPEALAVLLNALPEPLDPTLMDDDFGDFIYAPYSHFVAKYGCTEAYKNQSLDALKHMTMRFSCEDSIRYFINAFPNETLAKLNLWATDSNYHVRRLASEGSRPKLPWCQKINLTHTDTLPLLEALYTDPTRYVTRSVANHLNDISKIHPHIVTDTLKRWKTNKKANPKELEFIIKHSLRTLVKQGHSEALHFFDVQSNPALTNLHFSVKNDSIPIGNALEFGLDFTSLENQRFIVDYAISFIQKNGKLSKPKVYKLKQFHAQKEEKISLEKRHPLKAAMTTRTLYPGKHCLHLLVNGHDVKQLWFDIQ